YDGNRDSGYFQSQRNHFTGTIYVSFKPYANEKSNQRRARGYGCYEPEMCFGTFGCSRGCDGLCLFGGDYEYGAWLSLRFRSESASGNHCQRLSNSDCNFGWSTHQRIESIRSQNHFDHHTLYATTYGYGGRLYRTSRF